QEVTLNSRLYPQAYLGVVPITVADGRYRIGGHGRVIDYAVHMRRLPQERMMDRLLASGDLTEAMVEALADVIAAFHARSATSPAIARYGSPRTIGLNWHENFQQTTPHIGATISRWQHRYLHSCVRAFMTRQRRLLLQRVSDGRIRDCHGDLRAAAVCYTDAICVFDCIEFNRRFRYCDVASEVAFMAMDLDLHGSPHLAQRFVHRYLAATGDQQLPTLIDFYKCYRAYVRGKVEGFRLHQPEVPEAEKAEALATARRCFQLAATYASRQQPPLLLITCGLVATGKSALAETLTREMGLSLISSDIVRKELAGLAPQEHHYQPFGRGIYSPRFTRRTYKAIMERARALLEQGRSVVLDATFSHRWQRAMAQHLAQAAGALFFCLECVADADVVRQRLAQRQHDATTISDARWDTYQAQTAAFEPLTDLDDWHHIVVDTRRPFRQCLAQARAALATRLAPAAPPIRR
ncbi:MAG: AAA family ATPase, partial [Dehalococcoidia bacterium]